MILFWRSALQDDSSVLFSFTNPLGLAGESLQQINENRLDLNTYLQYFLFCRI